MTKKLIFYYIIIFSIVNVILSSIYFITTTNDTKSYFLISTTLPEIKNSLFPLLYPFVLKIINYFIGNQFISSKILSIISLFSVFIFYKKEKKFYAEFLIILFLPFIQTIICYSWSETLFIPLLFILIYTNYAFFKLENSSKKYIFWNTLVFILLFLTKYSAISILFVEVTFILYLYRIKDSRYKILLNSFIFSVIGVVFYLLINYYFTGYFTGKRSPAMNNNHYLPLYNFIYSFNPFFGRVILGKSINYNIAATIGILFLIFEIILIYKSKIWKFLFIKYILCLSSFFLIITVISYFSTRIDSLSSRLFLPFLILWYFVVVQALLKLKFLKTYYILIVILCVLNLFSLILSITNNVGNYR